MFLEKMSALLFSTTRRIFAIRPTGMQGATVYWPRIHSGCESLRAIGARMVAIRFRPEDLSPSAIELSFTTETITKPSWRTLTRTTQQGNRRSYVKEIGCHAKRFSEDNRKNDGGPSCARGNDPPQPPGKGLWCERSRTRRGLRPSQSRKRPPTRLFACAECRNRSPM